MQLLYVGFEQAKDVREYIFHGIAHGEETRVFVVSTKMALFLEFHLGVQEGPIMCLRTLAAEIEALGAAGAPPLHHIIDERDIRAYMASPILYGARKAGAKAGLRRKPATA
ncbi:MAG TPA: hypothetical protein VEV17_21385 [Bryobacteraceae bacterium]|nr:hypothetical protein [Bryobacteraceae bacterium]